MTEMLVVMVIIGVIAAVVVPQTLGQVDRAKARTVKMQLASVAGALESFAGDTGRYPSEDEGLEALINPDTAIEGWSGPYLRKASQIKDPWGQKLIYSPPIDESSTYTLMSYGSDKKEGGKPGPEQDIRAE